MDGEEEFNPLREQEQPEQPEHNSRKLRIPIEGESEKPGRLEAWYSKSNEW